MAPVMVVRIHEPAFDIEGDFLLKVYDRRLTKDTRKDECIEEWTIDRDIEFEKRWGRRDIVEYFYKLMAHDHLYYNLNKEEKELKD